MLKEIGYLFCGDLWRDGATGQRSRKRVPRLRQCRVPMIGNAKSLALRNNVCRQRFFFFADRQNGCLFHPRQLAERAFDFAQLDAISSDFDLLVTTTEELDCAIWSVAAEIAGAIPALVRERQKLLLATQGIVEIAFRDPNAANP